MAQKPKFDPLAISKLIIKLINGELNDAEQALLDEWLTVDPKNNVLLEDLLDRNLWEREVQDMNAFDAENALQKVLSRISNDGGKSEDTKRWFPRQLWGFLAAAAVLLIVFGAVFFFFDTKNPASENLQAKLGQNMPQQSDKVMLTLSDGSQVDIASLENGILKQGQATINKNAEGLTYEVNASGAAATSVAYNTLTVPMGKTYQLTLPDGTEVWLNAKSSLTYPVAFNHTERVVELSGEGYFEVAHLADKRFKVKSGNQVVEVLGTHFNIEAYPEDQKTVTTLIEGSVNVATKLSSIKIKPGQMAINSPSSPLHSQKANINEVLAWKNGMFSFNDDRIEDIMRKIARSYNMEVEYQGDVKDKRFWGVFPRDKGLSSLLKNLEQTNTIHFKVTGRRIIVMP